MSCEKTEPATQKKKKKIIIKNKKKTNFQREKTQTAMRKVRNPGKDISFPIFIRKEIETRRLEQKSKQKIFRLIDLFNRLNDIIII